MSKERIWCLSLLAMVVMVGSVVEISAKPAPGEPAFSVRKVEEQVVLYGLYRGSYDKVGRAIGKLFALAGQKGMAPCGPVSFVYLSNTDLVSSEHWLTEIRVPVEKEALQLAGTLGEFTDVKTLPAVEVAVAIKPEGQTDPGALYDSLAVWMLKEGYIGIESPQETFLAGAMAGNYAQMRTEIAVPVKKLSEQEDRVSPAPGPQ